MQLLSGGVIKVQLMPRINSSQGDLLQSTLAAGDVLSRGPAGVEQLSALNGTCALLTKHIQVVGVP